MKHGTQRRYPRYPCDRPLTAYRAYDEVTTVGIRGRWQTLGEGGAGAQMSEQLRTGEVIRLELTHSLCVYAAVRYGSGFYHGFEFVLLRDRQKAEIKRLCAEMGRDYPEQGPPTEGRSWRMH
jgi:hypothetical protein